MNSKTLCYLSLMEEMSFFEVLLAGGGLGLLYWWGQTRREKKTRGKWLKIMEPLAATLKEPVEVIDTLNTSDPDLKIDGRYEGYRIEAKCWVEDVNGYPRRFRLTLFDPAMPDVPLLKSLGSNRVGKRYYRIKKGIAFGLSERSKAMRFINWKRVLSEMAAEAKAIRKKERDRVVLR
ncbi:MAG: hypothetical protein AAF358_01900 [Pseudomonadota bacterium]